MSDILSFIKTFAFYFFGSFALSITCILIGLLKKNKYVILVGILIILMISLILLYVIIYPIIFGNT